MNVKCVVSVIIRRESAPTIRVFQVIIVRKEKVAFTLFMWTGNKNDQYTKLRSSMTRQTAEMNVQPHDKIKKVAAKFYRPRILAKRWTFFGTS